MQAKEMDDEVVKGQIIAAMNAFNPMPLDIKETMRSATPLTVASVWARMAVEVFVKLGGSAEDLKWS